MLLGGPILKPYHNPEEWLAHVRELRYTAVYFPVDHHAPDETVDAYARAARENSLVIAEVGVWRNLLSPDADEARAALAYAQGQLALAERVGAACCVNISGSRGTQWDGPHPLNFTDETFGMAVDSVRAVIDAVRPTRTFYSLEPMPWMYPHTADSCLALIKAVDRPAFAAHFDPVNIITNPFDYYRTGDIIREWFGKLGPYIKSCHAKDILLEGQLTVHLNEKPPGLGNLDYRTFIGCVEALGHDRIPMMTEHMGRHEDVVQAGAYIRGLMGE